jgi:hypothetical protein
MAPAGQISAEHDQRLAEIAKIGKLERRNVDIRPMSV